MKLSRHCFISMAVFLIVFNLLNNSNLLAAAGDIPTAQFLMVGQGPRAESLGGAVVANCFDYTSAYWNPAASAFLKNPEVGFVFTRLPAEITNSFISGFYPHKKYSLGFRVIQQQTKVDIYTSSGRTGATISDTSNNFNILAGYRLFEKFAFGIGTGATNLKIDNLVCGFFNANVGLMYKGDRLGIGLSASNIGNRKAYKGGVVTSTELESQPQIVRAGLAYTLLEDKSLTFLASIEKVTETDWGQILGLGTEFNIFKKTLALRTGFKNSLGGTKDTAFPVWTGGIGIKYKALGIDTSYSVPIQNVKGIEVLRLALSCKFGKIEGETSTTKVRLAKPERKPGEIINIAVADFGGKNVSQADGSIVADFLRTELVNTGVYNVVEKANMDKILAEAAFQQSGCTTSECAVQIGKMLNVKQMIVGSLSKLMDTYYITVNLVEVETGKIVASYDQEAMSAKELKTACNTLAQKLAE
ncbi:MAG: CsgG/HfaB family protein [Elusimicrobia bacterium]|nr:CsgG/HfaB family protein [Elusimicrobiota bacterium]